MFINIRLKSPMQSWGNQTYAHTSGEYRGTNEFPSYSGVFGLICACNGLNSKRNYQKYTELFSSIKYVSAVATKTFNILRDNQNMGGGYRKNVAHERSMVPLNSEGKGWVGMWRDDGMSNAKLSQREYLEDADFVVTIEADSEVGTSIVNALKNPVWIPVFGRSACIPSTKLFSGSFETYEDAIASAKSILNSEKLIAYLGTKPDGKYYAIDMYDVPVISQAFKYTRRKVYKTII